MTEKTKEQLPKCRYKNKDCFANSSGKCSILEAMPKGEKCPFFKNMARFARDRYKV